MSLKSRSLVVTSLALFVGGAVAVRAVKPQRATQAAAQAPAAADLVLRSGRIVTVDDKLPEAQALAARGGKIVAVGSNADIAKYLGPATQVIDLAGQFAMPGFIEGHGHF